MAKNKITVEVESGIYHLDEIDEYILPVVACMVRKYGSTSEQDHRVMIDALLAEIKSGNTLALWSYQVISRLQERLTFSIEKMNRIEGVIRETERI